MTAQTTTQVSKANFLGRVLQANGLFSGVSGAAFIVAAKPLAAFLGGVAPTVLIVLGVGLLLYALGLFREASQRPINRQFVIAAIIMDGAWVLGSIVLLLTDWVSFSVAGKWAVAIVADIVAVFAILQYYGWRRKDR